ncbi:putative F-box protein At5g55150 [Coffea eugenioides]|uniref:putative F-box protein At5g55150 n=1 Tax=Coffea eugenioides TaxID=49369 RepID=UPI000F60A3C8|nr:putative F-box protein At5g55150 [Coffea eugenioides]
MGDWSKLQHDLLELIAQQHLTKLEDYVAFGAVCTSWRAAAAKRKNFKGLKLWQQIPCLMLAESEDENDNHREFYSLIEKEIVAKISLPKLKGKKCYESLGWLLAVGQEGDMTLLNPFSDVEIPLPPGTTFPDDDWLNTDPEIFVEIFVLSARPSETSDFVVMLVCGSVGYLAFWRQGDQNWTKIETHNAAYSAVNYHNGQFYAIDCTGNLVACDVSGPNPTKARMITQLVRYSEESYRDQHLRDYHSNLIVDFKHLYLVLESSSSDKESLLVVTRDNYSHYADDDDQPNYGTTEFKLYEVDLSGGTWKEIHSLGNKAVFVGHSASTSLQVSSNKFSLPGIQPNHIYFTDDCWDAYKSIQEVTGGKDMGVYNLETGTIQPFYQGPRRLSNISPSIWITPKF